MNGKLNSILNHAVQILLEVYLFILCTVFPLYVGEGKYRLIAYNKYGLFRYSWIMIGVFLVLFLLRFILEKRVAFRLRKTDIPVVLYLISLMISYWFAVDREEAFNGASGWFVGFLPSLTMIVIFFIYSRYFHWHKRQLLYPFLGSFGVILLCVLNRFRIAQIDPENYITTFISTIGNINWIASYLAVLVPLFTGIYLSGIVQKRMYRALFLVWLLAGDLALLTNGSNSIWLFVPVLFVFMGLFGLTDREIMKRVWIWVLLFGLACLFLHTTRYIYGEEEFYKILGDEYNLAVKLTSLVFCIPVIIVSAVFLYVLKKNTHLDMSAQNGYRILSVLSYTGLALIVLLVILQSTGILTLEDTFGHNRGFLWRISAEFYRDLPMYRKWIGVGPDCFGWSTINDWDMLMKVQEYYPNMRITNAHSEPLTMLVNLGICGTASYLLMISVFVHQLLEKKGRFLAVILLPLVCYHVNNLTSFRLIISEPYIFLLMSLLYAYLYSGTGEESTI